MSFFKSRRRSQWGSLPNRKPNKHRLFPSVMQPLRYPADAHDIRIPYNARRELKTKIFRIWREAHREATHGS